MNGSSAVAVRISSRLVVVHLAIDRLAVAVDELRRCRSRPLPEYLADLDVPDAVALGQDVGGGRLARARRSRDRESTRWLGRSRTARSPAPARAVGRGRLDSSAGRGASARIRRSADGERTRSATNGGTVAPGRPARAARPGRVDRVARDGVADRRQVDADLVRAPGHAGPPRAASSRSRSLLDAVAGHRRPTVEHDGHPSRSGADHGRWAPRCDRPPPARAPWTRARYVFLTRRALSWRHQRVLGVVVAGDDDQAAGVAIEAVDDARPLVAGDGAVRLGPAARRAAR